MLPGNYKSGKGILERCKKGSRHLICVGLLSVGFKIKCEGENNKEHGGKWNEMSHLFNQR